MGHFVTDATRVKNLATSVDLSTRANSMYWETQLTGVRFGEDEKEEWGFVDKYVQYNSGV